MYEDPASQLFKRVVVDDSVCCFIEFWFCNDDLVGRRLDDFPCDGAKVDCSRKLGEVFKRIRIVNFDVIGTFCAVFLERCDQAIVFDGFADCFLGKFSIVSGFFKKLFKHV